VVEAEAVAIKSALAASQGRDFASARAILGDFLKETPSSARAVFAQGQVELAAGEYSDAEALFRKAGAIDGTIGAELEAENARALTRDDATVLSRARRLIASKETSESGLRLLETLTARSPSNFDARVALAEAQFASGSPIRGLFSYSRALSIAEGAQIQELESRFADFVRRAPGDAFSRSLLGKAQLRLGKTDEALETLTLATQLSGDQEAYRSDEAQAHLAVADEHLASGRIDAALASIERAYSLDPAEKKVKAARAEAYYERAAKRLQIGNANGAIDDLDAALRDAKAGGDNELLTRIGRRAYSTGRTLEARHLAQGAKIGREVTAYQIAFDIDPENRAYRAKLGNIRAALGDQFKNEGNTLDAALSYRQAYETNRSRTDWRDSAITSFRTYAATRQAAYAFNEAIAHFRNAFELDPTNAASRLGLAEAYSTAGLWARDTLGQRSQAADYFREALHLFPDNATYQGYYNSVYP
jgi:tetratricopeptide (TPR) repeat protein